MVKAYLGVGEAYLSGVGRVIWGGGRLSWGWGGLAGVGRLTREWGGLPGGGEAYLGWGRLTWWWGGLAGGGEAYQGVGRLTWGWGGLPGGGEAYLVAYLGVGEANLGVGKAYLEVGRLTWGWGGLPGGGKAYLGVGECRYCCMGGGAISISSELTTLTGSVCFLRWLERPPSGETDPLDIEFSKTVKILSHFSTMSRDTVSKLQAFEAGGHRLFTAAPGFPRTSSKAAPGGSRADKRRVSDKRRHYHSAMMLRVLGESVIAARR
ncbi:hypothetical protein Bbelb_162370 [Branchiostoma belcheri]|nr:hypothetical protein Bbelb_162370 [Branchiostoma belcheri]